MSSYSQYSSYYLLLLKEREKWFVTKHQCGSENLCWEYYLFYVSSRILSAHVIFAQQHSREPSLLTPELSSLWGGVDNSSEVYIMDA